MLESRSQNGAFYGARRLVRPTQVVHWQPTSFPPADVSEIAVIWWSTGPLPVKVRRKLGKLYSHLAKIYPETLHLHLHYRSINIMYLSICQYYLVLSSLFYLKIYLDQPP